MQHYFDFLGKTICGIPEVTLEGKDSVATELHSEPSYCIVLREFTSSGAFGRESDESSVECHIVLEGRVRVLDPGPGEELAVGSCRALSGSGSDKLSGMRGTRVISLYSPRVPLSSLVNTADDPSQVSAE